jgi:hypothetical protein
MNNVVSLDQFRMKRTIDNLNDPPIKDRYFLVRLKNDSLYAYAHVIINPEIVLEIKTKIEIFKSVSREFNDLKCMAYDFYTSRLTERAGEDPFRDDVLRFVNENPDDVVIELPPMWDSPASRIRTNTLLLIGDKGLCWEFDGLETRYVPFAFIEQLVGEIESGSK